MINNINLKVNLELYKDITIQIKNHLDLGDYDLVNQKLELREEVLMNIKDYDVEKVKQIYLDMNIQEMDLKIRTFLEEELISTKNEIIKYRNTKKVNSTYYKNSIQKINIFNKKV